MEHNEKRHEIFSGLGVVPSYENNEIQIKSSLGGMRRLAEYMQTKKALENFDKPEVNKAKASVSGTENNDFAGGTPEDLKQALAGTPDLTNAKKAKADLAGNSILQKLKTTIGTKVKRKRINDDNYGSFDYSRRYDDKPFSRLAKRPKLAPIVVLDAFFMANCNIKAKDLDKYGAMVWAISQILADAGYLTEINFRMRTERATGNTGKALDTQVTVKGATEYITPGKIAGVFTTNFFRRVGFALLATAPQLINEPRDWGLGRSPKEGAPVEFKDGSLVLYPAIIHEGVEKLTAEILKAIK